MATTLRTGASPVTVEVDPISRIEGHLGVKVTVGTDGYISDAKAHGNLWRGFENFLLGRDINDAITYTQRICGVCPVPHGQAATFAADTVLGYSKGHITFAYDGDYGIPQKAVLIRNLVLSAEYLMSSITHFYHLAAPSYVQGPAMPPWTPYFDDEYYASLLRSAGKGVGGGGQVPNTVSPKLWDAVILSYVKALKIRRKTFEAGALFAGRMPMTSCFVAGGVTTVATDDLTSRITKFTALIEEVADFIVKEYVPIAMALGFLYQDFDSQTMVGAETATTSTADHRGFGGGIGRFLSWGAFPGLDNKLGLYGGLKDTITPANDFQVTNKTDVYNKFLTGTTSVPANLTEDISNSRYDIYADDAAAFGTPTASRPNRSASASYPGDVTRTKPLRSKGYTYMKGPRWKGLNCEVGPLARLAVMGAYPVDGRLLADVVPGYGLYVKNSALDADMVAPAIVAALGASGDNVLTPVANWILTLKGGLSTMDRLRARALESLVLVQKMVGSVYKVGGATPDKLGFRENGWVHQLKCLTNATYAGTNPFQGSGTEAVSGLPKWGLTLVASNAAGTTWRNVPAAVGTFQGWGATEAPRGALMHQAKTTNGRIDAYQCIVPTTWNGSPAVGATTSGSRDNRGAIEAAMIGAPFSSDSQTFTKANGDTSAETQGGVEVLRIAQSFDPCIACAVH